VRKNMCVWLWLVLLAVACAAVPRAQDKGAPGEQFVGTWTGTWDGAGTGGFTLTLQKGKDGAVAGRVAVTGEPTYETAIGTLSFDGAKMTAKYDFPEDATIEVVLTATFVDNKATGAWSARQKAGGTEVAAGGWTVTRK
jgi:hypothetical protein